MARLTNDQIRARISGLAVDVYDLLYTHYDEYFEMDKTREIESWLERYLDVLGLMTGEETPAELAKKYRSYNAD